MARPLSFLLVAVAAALSALVLVQRLEEPSGTAESVVTPKSTADDSRETSIGAAAAPRSRAPVEAGTGDTPEEPTVAPIERSGEDEPSTSSPERAIWERRYDGMSASQLAAELEALSVRYTEEMSRVTWPRYRSGDYETAKSRGGQRPPASTDDALVAVFGARADGLVPYVVVTADEEPELHAWMREMLFLQEQIERASADESTDTDEGSSDG
ncbi:MAG: hypothetical protein AAGI22_13635 [Planctomycetota bacterium]